MSMTLDEMKLAVCEKLPGLILNRGTHQLWLPSLREIHWTTEGLTVCHEAEKLLVGEQQPIYWDYLCKLNRHPGFKSAASRFETRLEALCRVWHPERFTK